MSALSDALAAAQSRAVAALGKQYVAETRTAGTLKAGNYDAGRWTVPF